MKYKLLALDLDGTLTNSEKKVTEYTKNVLEEVMRCGVKIVLASGRPLLGISAIADYLELDRFGGYILAYNGGQIVECATKQVLFEKLVSSKYAKKICEVARASKVQPLTYYGKQVIAESDTDAFVQKEAYNNSTTIRVVEKLDEFVTWDVPKYMVVGEHKSLLEVQKALNVLFSGVLSIFFSEPYFLEVVPCGIEKATALALLTEHIGLTRESVMAIGDGLNDLPMLRYAGMPIAMANAYAEVKAEARYITLSNDEDGVAKAVEALLLQKK
ncbi:MAG: HAD family phosphatase [Lachnospiraceae bacterium]|nr:HAD family phosphatase [Lachnospiraceae bacterium]